MGLSHSKPSHSQLPIPMATSTSTFIVVNSLFCNGKQMEVKERPVDPLERRQRHHTNPAATLHPTTPHMSPIDMPKDGNHPQHRSHHRNGSAPKPAREQYSIGRVVSGNDGLSAPAVAQTIVGTELAGQMVQSQNGPNQSGCQTSVDANKC